MKNKPYEQKLEKDYDKYEAICARCGECCGIGTDPCQRLIAGENNRYYCNDYPGRLGPQRTISGKIFNCVQIRDNIEKGFYSPNCAYTKAQFPAVRLDSGRQPSY